MTDSDWLEETQTEEPLFGRGIENKNVSCGLDEIMWRQSKITPPILDEHYEGVPQLLRSCENVNNEQAHMITRIDIEKDNIKMSVTVTVSVF